MGKASFMRLAGKLRYALYATGTALVGSGVMWLVAHYLALRWFAAESPENLAMRIHGAATMAILPIAGAAVALHVVDAWREGRNRLSGLILGATVVILTVSGYGLYYVGGESLRGVASLSHWVVGLALPVIFGAHAWLARRPTSPRDVAASTGENPENATAASAMRR
jgi:hypothetical protein